MNSCTFCVRVAKEDTIAAKTNEMGAFGEMFEQTEQEHGGLYEIATVDSGCCSAENAARVNAAGKGYVMALKDNQPTLLAEAQRLLGNRTEAEAELVGEWETRGSKRIRRLLFRTTEIAGFGDFPALRQAWRICQQTMEPSKVKTWETVDKKGKRKLKQKVLEWELTAVEDRYFLSNLLSNYLNPWQALLVVRDHWGIENNCFWTLDTQWEEDQKAWVMTGDGILAFSWLRLMAYNLVQLLRHRYLRRHSRDEHKADKRAFRDWFDIIRRALEAALPDRAQQVVSPGN